MVSLALKVILHVAENDSKYRDVALFKGASSETASRFSVNFPLIVKTPNKKGQKTEFKTPFWALHNSSIYLLLSIFISSLYFFKYISIEINLFL